MNPDNRVWANPDLLKLFIWCLLKANYADKRWVSHKSGKGRIDVQVKRGQFVYGRHSAAEDLGINPSTMRVRMQKLAALGFISIKSASQYSIITVCNYGYYQGLSGEGMPINAQAIRQAKQQPDTTTKNVKNVKKVKKEPNPLLKFEEFWEEYPRKRSKGQARKAWLRLNLDNGLFEKIMSSLVNAKKSQQWNRDGKQYVPYPSTWLNAEGWDDEVIPATEEPNPFERI
jgi:hypothetical protein